jgi:hypothetical protein
MYPSREVCAIVEPGGTVMIKLLDDALCVWRGTDLTNSKHILVKFFKRTREVRGLLALQPRTFYATRTRVDMDAEDLHTYLVSSKPFHVHKSLGVVTML